MPQECLDFQVADRIATVTFANPPVNLMNARLRKELDEVLDQLRNDPEVRVLLLQSADPEFFIAHGDMTSADDPSAFLTMQTVAADQDLSLNPMMRLYEKLRSQPQLTVVKLRGIARGGGAELVSAAHIRFGSSRAALSQMEALGGIIPGAGGTAYLPRLIGEARALEVILGAALIDAHTAEHWGWLNRVIPDEELDHFVDAFVRRVAGLPDGVLEAVLASVDVTAPMKVALSTANSHLTQLFSQPAAASRARALLSAGAQTRDGERRLEELLQ